MSLARHLEAYLSRARGGPVAVAALERIAGGASRETYRFAARDGAGERRLILRRDPVASLLTTDRAAEYRAYQTAHAAGLPVPEPVALEPDGAELGRPFFLTAEVAGGTAASPFRPDPFGAHAGAVGEQFFGTLGRLAAVEPAGTPLAAVLDAPEPGECWRVALDRWEAVIDADETYPQPIVRAAIRRLRASPPPPPAGVRIVHGDYRSGNVLHDGAGTLLAVLDWEMAHLGDPVEDLGWAFDPMWDHGDPSRVCGTVPRERALATWEAASGLAADPRAVRWWTLFAAVKGRAIWTTSARQFADGGCADPVLGFSGWYTARRHDLILADALAAWDA